MAQARASKGKAGGSVPLTAAPATQIIAGWFLCSVAYSLA